jgi:hypothetical protein
MLKAGRQFTGVAKEFCVYPRESVVRNYKPATDADKRRHFPMRTLTLEKLENYRAEMSPFILNPYLKIQNYPNQLSLSSEISIDQRSLPSLPC